MTSIFLLNLLLSMNCKGDFVDPKITERYDKFKDFKMTRLEQISWPDINLEMSLGRFIDGRKPNTSLYSIHFVSKTDNWRFLKNNAQLVLLVDNKRLDLGNPRKSQDVVSGGVLEQMHINIPASQLKQFAKASTIEAQLGYIEFKFTPSQLLAVRTFVFKLWPTEFEDPKILAQKQPKPKLGFSYQPITAKIASKYSVSDRPYGNVLITKVESGGFGECLGFKVGQIIKEVDGKKPTSVSEVSNLIRTAYKKSKFIMTVSFKKKYTYGPPKYVDTNIHVDFLPIQFEQYVSKTNI